MAMSIRFARPNHERKIINHDLVSSGVLKRIRGRTRGWDRPKLDWKVVSFTRTVAETKPGCFSAM